MLEKINQPLNSQLISVDELNEKKHLASVSLLAVLNTAIDQTNENTNDNDSHESLQQAMAEMQGILAELMGKYAKIQQELENGQLQVGATVASASKEESELRLKETTDQISKNEQQGGQQKLFTALEIIGTIIGSAIAILTGNPEVAIALIAMTIASTTGGMSKLTDALSKGIAKGLEAAGMGSDEAQKVASALAAAIVVVATIVVTLGVGAVGGAAIATLDTVAEETAEEGATLASKAIGGLKNGVKSGIRISVMTGTQATAGTNAIVNIFEAAAVKSSNPKLKEALEILGEIIQLVVAIVGAVVGGGGSSAESSESSLLNLGKNLISKLSSLSERFSSLMEMVQEAGATLETKLSSLSTARLKVLATSALLLAQALPAGPQIGMGAIDIQLGKQEEILSELKANISQLKTEADLNQMAVKKTQEDTKVTLQSFVNLIQNISNYIAPMQAEASVLARAS